jgi:hypothetical membrane protein
MKDSVSGATAVRTRSLGAAATLLALGGIVVAILLDPTFSWSGDALSDLGVRPRSAVAFNWGLILGGAVGVGYAVGLGATQLPSEGADSGGDRSPTRATSPLCAAVLGLALVAMAGVGAFDLTRPLHGPAAVGFYALVTAVFAIDGSARRDTRRGRAVLAFVPAHLAIWVTYIAGWWPVTGLALPELPGALMLAAWVWLFGPLPVLGAPATDEH